MTVAAYQGVRNEARPARGEGDRIAMPSLPRGGLCALALPADERAEAASDPGGDHRTSRPLLGGSPGGRESVSNLLPESLERRWMSFCGVPAAQIVQDYFLWEMLLNENPQLKGIVELGTWQGGFSLYLAAQARQRGFMFRTYDVLEPENEIPGFCRLDIFAHANIVGEHLAQYDPVALLCDGGNKPRELRTFSEYLSPRSVMVVHDWGTEFLSEDVPANVEMIYEEQCESIDSMSRAFKVRA